MEAGVSLSPAALLSVLVFFCLQQVVSRSLQGPGSTLSVHRVETTGINTAVDRSADISEYQSHGGHAETVGIPGLLLPQTKNACTQGQTCADGVLKVSTDTQDKQKKASGEVAKKTHRKYKLFPYYDRDYMLYETKKVGIKTNDNKTEQRLRKNTSDIALGKKRVQHRSRSNSTVKEDSQISSNSRKSAPHLHGKDRKRARIFYRLVSGLTGVLRPVTGDTKGGGFSNGPDGNKEISFRRFSQAPLNLNHLAVIIKRNNGGIITKTKERKGLQRKVRSAEGSVQQPTENSPRAGHDSQAPRGGARDRENVAHRARRNLRDSGRGEEFLAPDFSSVIGDFLGVNHSPQDRSEGPPDNQLLRQAFSKGGLDYLKERLGQIVHDSGMAVSDSTAATERRGEAAVEKRAATGQEGGIHLDAAPLKRDAPNREAVEKAYKNKLYLTSIGAGPMTQGSPFAKTEGSDVAPGDLNDDLTMDFNFDSLGAGNAGYQLINSIIDNNRVRTDDLYMDDKMPRDFRTRRSSGGDDLGTEDVPSVPSITMEKVLTSSAAEMADKDETQVLEKLDQPTGDSSSHKKVQVKLGDVDFNDNVFKDNKDDKFEDEAKAEVVEDPVEALEPNDDEPDYDNYYDKREAQDVVSIVNDSDDDDDDDTNDDNDKSNDNDNNDDDDNENEDDTNEDVDSDDDEAITDEDGASSGDDNDVTSEDADGEDDVKNEVIQFSESDSGLPKKDKRTPSQDKTDRYLKKKHMVRVHETSELDWTDNKAGKGRKDPNPNNPYPRIPGFRGDALGHGMMEAGSRLPVGHGASDRIMTQMTRALERIDEMR